MKKLRIILSMVLCAAFLFGITPVGNIPAEAAGKNTSTYVALGDSITTGYGLVSFSANDSKNKSSANNFVNKLSNKLGKKAVNLGVEGLNSNGLLGAIIRPATAEQKSAVAQIKKASVITLSIGGNNVLQPIIAVLNERLGEDKTIYNSSAQEIQTAAMGLILDNVALEKLQKTALEGASKFIGDSKLKKTGELASIISQVKKLNPKAQIIVLTIYNPYKSLLPETFNTSITSMNAEIIKGSANGKNYKVADIYSAFSKASYGAKLVNSDTGISFDPHPTAKGHEVIYTVAAYTAQNNILPYNVKATITKGKLTTKVFEGEILLTIIPTKGYKAPTTISLIIGKGTKQTLTLKNGVASLPIADVGANIVVNGVCSK